MTLAVTAPIEQPPPTKPIVLRGISWDAYEALRNDLDAANQKMYLTYDDGALEIMPPSPFHERGKTLLGRFIEIMSLDLNIPVYGLGSTTFKRRDLKKGLEPDECYYVQHEPLMGSRTEIDLQQDPPPDLALEMDYTHHAVNRPSVYAALGVPEVWQFDGTRLRGVRRTDAGTYEPITTSIAFPFLKLEDVERFLIQAQSKSQHEAVVAFRDWVRRTHGRKA
jgi:Uma2 family endonuclease